MAICAVAIVAACSRTYQGEEIRGKVIDSATKRPIPGVIVVAKWVLDPGHMEGYGKSDLWLDETLTNFDGDYLLDRWGPIKSNSGRVLGTAPTLIFFRKGYHIKGLSNRFGSRSEGARLISEWNGQVVELDPFTSPQTDYFPASLQAAAGLLSSPRDPCAWEHLPMLTAELIVLSAQSSSAIGSFAHPENLRAGGKCRDPNVILQDYISKVHQ